MNKVRQRLSVYERMIATPNDDAMIVEEFFDRELARKRVFREEPDVEVNRTIVQICFNGRKETFNELELNLGEAMYKWGSEHAGGERRVPPSIIQPPPTPFSIP